MQDNAKSDIDFQPKTKEYSYSTKAGASKKYGIYLLTGVIFLVIILLGALYYLNNSENINSDNIKTATKQEVSQNTKNLGAPFYNPNLKQTVASAIFVGINKNNLKVQTSEGNTTFTIDSNTTFGSLVANSNTNSTSGGVLDPGRTYYTAEVFAKEVPKGSFLQIFYTTNGANSKAIKIFYIPGHKFN